MEEMQDIWSSMEEPQPKAEQVAKIAVGEKEAHGLSPFTAWERILSEIITGDVFGADRMDYLLRDSLHAGVTYGHFDHHRLIDTMRILPGTAKDVSQEHDSEPELGIERGGLQVAESLLVARYLMFSQVYFHHVRRSYDLHLEAFLKKALPGGEYPTDLREFFDITDDNILGMIKGAARDESREGHDHAKCIFRRKHFKKVFHATPQECLKDTDILHHMAEGLSRELGSENVMTDGADKRISSQDDFPIRIDDGRIFSAQVESKVLNSLPMATTGYVFVKRELKDKACAWRDKTLKNI